MGDKDLTSKELKKIAKFLDKKVKPIAIKHGKKIGGAALTAVTKTASTFSPLKKVKIPYKAGQAVATGVKIVKPIVQKTIKKLKNVWKQPTKVKEVKKGKFNKSQFETVDKDWGNPTITNILFKSKKSVKAIDKKLNKKSGYLQTHKISKANYVKGLKDRKSLKAFRQNLIDTKQY